MSRIAFFCIPAHGHTNPTLGVVRELVSRGHEVRYYSYESMREKIEGSGAQFIPCDEYDTQQKLTPQDGARIGSDIAFSTKILVDTTLALDQAVCSEMEMWKPDCIVADSMAFWGKAVAKKLGVPLVSSTTTFAFNRNSSKGMNQGGKDLLGMLFSIPRANRQVKRLQRQGYPVKNVLDIIGNDNETHTVVYTSPEFQPCAETFSEKYAFVGPMIRTVETPFQKEREQLVYISMGTVNNEMLPLYQSCVEAFRESPYQVVLSVGEMVDPSLLGELPEHISVFPHVDQIALLEQADVFLTHCGMNSVNESLYFGVPLVMLPQTPEQNRVANRVEELGAGLRLSGQTPEAIREAAAEVLGDPSYSRSAAGISNGMKKCSGVNGAVEKILSLCK